MKQNHLAVLFWGWATFLATFLLPGCSNEEHRTATEAANLNDRRYAIELWQSGQSAGADTLHFENNVFESTWCRGYGFPPSPFKMESENEALIWQSLSQSMSDGRVEWRGTVRGDAIEGSLTWQKEGQAPC
jgi:hypothetical protein